MCNSMLFNCVRNEGITCFISTCDIIGDKENQEINQTIEGIKSVFDSNLPDIEKHFIYSNLVALDRVSVPWVKSPKKKNLVIFKRIF